MQPEYWRDITDSVFESIRTHRDGKTYEVVNYADAGPISLWTIARAIEGVTFDAEWQRSTTRPRCPRWNEQDTKHP
jgi:hypothetical protein